MANKTHFTAQEQVDEQLNAIYSFFNNARQTLVECCKQFGTGETNRINFVQIGYSPFADNNYSLLEYEDPFCFVYMELNGTQDDIIFYMHGFEEDIEIGFEELNNDLIIISDLLHHIFKTYKIQ